MRQPIPIHYEHSQFVVIDKPAGISFHSETEPGLVVRVEQQLNHQLYPVHRLDKMTSGLVVLAKSVEVARHFQQLFENRDIEKYYLAISTHKPKKKQGWIKGDMAPSRRGSYRLFASKTNPAITQFVSCSLAPSERLFLVKPHTGKTHQIRVALKSLGSPIAGDHRYQASDEAALEDRGYLHAFGLRFQLDNQVYAFVCPPSFGARFLSAAFRLQCQAWHDPWQHF